MKFKIPKIELEWQKLNSYTERLKLIELHRQTQFINMLFIIMLIILQPRSTTPLYFLLGFNLLHYGIEGLTIRKWRKESKQND